MPYYFPETLTKGIIVYASKHNLNFTEAVRRIIQTHLIEEGLLPNPETCLHEFSELRRRQAKYLVCRKCGAEFPYKIDRATGKLETIAEAEYRVWEEILEARPYRKAYCRYMKLAEEYLEKLQFSTPKELESLKCEVDEAEREALQILENCQHVYLPSREVCCKCGWKPQLEIKSLDELWKEKYE